MSQNVSLQKREIIVRELRKPFEKEIQEKELILGSRTNKDLFDELPEEIKKNLQFSKQKILISEE